jgi:probable phosphoglycerate mutase
MLILARHGRTVANAGGLLQGRVDNPLDAVGRRQAAAQARHLGQIDRVVASPLRRARETAEAYGHPVEVDERFIELDYGEWDGRPVGEVPAEVWAMWSTDAEFRPPGGETLVELRHRVEAGLEDLLSEAEDRTIVVVSHVSPIKAGIMWVLGVPDAVSWRMHLDTGSVSAVAVRRGRPVLSLFNFVPDIGDDPSIPTTGG